MDGPQYSAAQALLRAAESFWLPDWTRWARVGAVSPGTSVVLQGGLDDVQPGDAALVWEAAGNKYEIVEIDAAGANTTTVDEVTQTYGDARLFPLLAANASEGISIQRPAGTRVFAQIGFDIEETPYIGASDYAQYREHDVLPVCPVVGDGALDEGMVWTAEVIDSGLGIRTILRERTRPDLRFMMRWHVFSRDEDRAVKRWLYSRYGTQKAFWMSSWSRDFLVKEPIGSADTVITVLLPSGLQSYPQGTFDIEIRTQSGASFYRQVSEVQSASGGIGLAINTAIGQSLSVESVRRISFLRCARFDSNRVECLHRPGEGMAAAVPCIEVNIP
jgi:hypothetical protein